jgi:hypothetical protein
MATQYARFEPVAWWWTRNQIGQHLRELYEVPKELPPKLLALVRKLAAVEGKHRLRTSASRLDAIEGNYLLRYATPVEPRSVGPSDDWFGELAKRPSSRATSWLETSVVRQHAKAARLLSLCIVAPSIGAAW